MLHRDVGLDVQIYRDPALLPQLRGAWDALIASVPYFSAAQTYAYTAAALRVMGRPELAVITVWRGGQLALVWPLYVRQEGRLTIATHPGLGDNGEYAGPTISDPEPEKTADLALATAKGLADALDLYALRSDSPMAAAIKRAGGFKYSNHLLSPVVDVTAYETFDAFLAGKSGSFRAELRNDRKRMAATGAVTFDRMNGPEDGPELIDWLFRTKTQWLADRKIDESWILKPRGRNLCKALISEPDGANPEAHPFQAFVLRLDGKIAAGCVCYRSSDVLEYYLTAFDPAFKAFSPGNLLIEDLCRWAQDQGLDFDFRITRDAYKMRWRGRDVPYETHIIACSPRAIPQVLRFEANRAVNRVKMKLGPMVKRLKKRR